VQHLACRLFVFPRIHVREKTGRVLECEQLGGARDGLQGIERVEGEVIHAVAIPIH
jgi:hypothetical protein